MSHRHIHSQSERNNSPVKVLPSQGTQVVTKSLTSVPSGWHGADGAFLSYFGPSPEWIRTTHIGTGYPLSMLIQILISSKNTLKGQSNIRPRTWAPVAQSSCCRKLTITWLLSGCIPIFSSLCPQTSLLGLRMGGGAQSIPLAPLMRLPFPSVPHICWLQQPAVQVKDSASASPHCSPCPFPPPEGIVVTKGNTGEKVAMSRRVCI